MCHHRYYGHNLQVEYPTGSGVKMGLEECAVSIMLPNIVIGLDTNFSVPSTARHSSPHDEDLFA
jgi:hypothetical protein